MVIDAMQPSESKKYMRRRFTSATVALIAVIELVAVISWWQVGEVRSHARNSAAIQSLTQYVNLAGSEGFRVAYDPDADERDEARGILSIALGQLARL